MLKITALQEGFRRCGIIHSRRGTTYPDNHWSPEQVETLKAEPMLKVEEVVDADSVVTDPPAAAPVVTDPPAADSVVTDPPAAAPVVTDPPTADSVVTDPPAAAPVVTDPPATKAKPKAPAKPAAAAKPKGKK